MFDTGHDPELYDLDGDADFDRDPDDGDYALDGADVDRDHDGLHDVDHDPDPMDEGPGGTGRERDDVPAAPPTSMLMSRRDIRQVYSEALRDRRRAVAKRTERSVMPPIGSFAVQATEVLGGIAASVAFEQRFRRAGATIPVGVTTGLLTGLAAYLGVFGPQVGPHMLRVALGLGGGSLALYMAGLTAARTADADGPRTAGRPNLPRPLASLFGQQEQPPAAQQFVPQQFAPQQFAPQQQFAPPPFVPQQAYAAHPPAGRPATLADIQNLVASRRAA